MDKKQIERDILSLVYENNKYGQIVDSERPDFRIKNKGFDIPFGVEITEFYFSQSNARIRNIPDYFTEILDSDQYRHKDDKKILEVVEFEIFAPDGTSKGKTRGVFQEAPPPNEYVEMIRSAILNKEQKFKEYAQDLAHINLLIFDTEHRFQTVPVSQFFRNFFTPQLKDTLYSSNFREIFLITILEKSRKIYLPLKMLLLLANFYMVGQLILDYPWETTDLVSQEPHNKNSPRNIMSTFAHYMRAKTDKVILNDDKEQIEVIFGNSGIVFDGNHVNIHDYNDYPLPKNAKNISENAMTSFFTSPEFKEKEQELMEKFVFSTELAFDTKGDWKF
jgi:hypothetical protein